MSKPEEISCYAAKTQSQSLERWTYVPRATKEDEVVIDIHYCGICGSGHEIIGKISSVGDKVKSLKVGDTVGVGPQVLSCGNCDRCMEFEDQNCSKRVFTYSDRYEDGTITKIIVNEEFAFSIPAGIPLEKAGPLLCAGATVYVPLKLFSGSKNKAKIGVVGIGGLGHMALQFGKAMGYEMFAISHSAGKKDECLNMFKASYFIDSSKKDELESVSQKLDGIIMTSNAGQDCLDMYVDLLRIGGILVLVAIQGETLSFSPTALVACSRSIRTSLIAGKEDMKEMLEFAEKHSIFPLTEQFEISNINEAISRVRKGDVRYRAVLKIMDETI